MIDCREAVRRAFGYLNELVGHRELANLEEIHLEEFELSDDSRHWNVTLSYPVKKLHEDEETPATSGPLGKFLADSPRRKWRTFKIDAADGQLVAMKVPASSSAS